MEILVILTIGIYFIMMGSSMLKGFDDFLLGFKEGYEQSSNKNKVKPSDKKSETTFFLELKAKGGYDAFPDSIVNLNSGENVKIRYGTSQISISEPEEVHISAFRVWSMVLASILIVIILLIPILFIKLNLRLRKEMIFEKQNILLMRRLGLLLLLYYFLYALGNWLAYKANSMLFEFKNYKIQLEQADIIWLLLGMVVLLIAEVVSQGAKMKEEQDLTI